MASSNPARVLVISDQATPGPSMLTAIRARAARGAAEFRIVVTNPARAEWHLVHPERHVELAEARRDLADALPLVEEAAGHAVEGVVSIRHDPMDAIEENLNHKTFDELIIAIAPHNLERRLHVDLAHRLAHRGLTITTVSSDEPVATTV